MFKRTYFLFTLRQIIERVTSWQKPVMVNFIDFRKAFDCIHRPSLWSILRQYGIPEEIVNIIQNLYKDSKSNVKINGISSEWFKVVTGVHVNVWPNASMMRDEQNRTVLTKLKFDSLPKRWVQFLHHM